MNNKILLIDDEPGIGRSLSLVLDTAGIKTTVFTDPIEALNHIKAGANFYNLILSDLRMPKMDGLHLIAEIKKLGILTKIILMSAHATENEILQARALGVDEFLAKPFLPEDLILKVKGYIKSA